MPPAQLATNAERAAISLASRIEAEWWRRGAAVAPFTRAGRVRRTRDAILDKMAMAYGRQTADCRCRMRIIVPFPSQPHLRILLQSFSLYSIALWFRTFPLPISRSANRCFR